MNIFKYARLAPKFELMIYLSKKNENLTPKFDKLEIAYFFKFSLCANRLHYSANQFAQCIFSKMTQNALCEIDCTLGEIDCIVKK